jgi:hypothetical protein
MKTLGFMKISTNALKKINDINYSISQQELQADINKFIAFFNWQTQFHNAIDI